MIDSNSPTSQLHDGMSKILFGHAEGTWQRASWAFRSLRYWRYAGNLTVLDLGTGMGAINIVLHRHYVGLARFIYLDRSEFDRDGMISISTGEQPGFGVCHPFYGHLTCARDIAILNGVNDVQTLELTRESDGLWQLSSGSVDIVHSIASWGYHYPIALHLEQVKHILRRGGVLVVTLRFGTKGLKALTRGGFRKCRTLQNVTSCVFQ